MTGKELNIEPFMMAVLSSRLYNIGMEMTNTLVRTARSVVMNAARDLSCTIADSNGDLVAIPPGIPVHVANMGLVSRSILEWHKNELKPGDAYINNSPYHGNTHMADNTIVVPVFYKGELVFITAARGHQADIGYSIPTTYHAIAKDIYAEGGMNFPCVKIQQEYEDVHDVIRMAMVRIRCADVWYGDYLAELGAARIGERRLIELCDKYGVETVKAFNEQWHEYGRRRMIEEIRKLPRGTWYNETKHDPLPEILPEGVLVKLKMTIDPDEGYITLDFTESSAKVPCGLNMCAATLMASARAGVLNRLPPDIPHCEGAMERIVLVMNEDSSVGKAKLPYSSSVATTNVADRVVNCVQTCFNQVTEVRGIAEGIACQAPAAAVISGTDSRFGGRDYVNQLIFGWTGGPGVKNHDGWVTYELPVAGGILYWNSTEVVEQRYPIQIRRCEIIPDSQGAGKWDSAPACRTDIVTCGNPVTFACVADGHIYPPKGAAGGGDATRANVWKYDLEEGESTREDLPRFLAIELGKKRREVFVSECSSGGGYGDPLERYPEMVRHRVREGWTSLKRAREVYGVAVDTSSEMYTVDYETTEKLRNELKKKRSEEQ